MTAPANEQRVTLFPPDLGRGSRCVVRQAASFAGGDVGLLIAFFLSLFGDGAVVGSISLGCEQEMKQNDRTEKIS